MNTETDAEDTKANDCNTYESATKTFAIPELLELILLHLDMKMLLLAQRVDTQWRGAIASSKKLQKKLFLLPVESFEEALLLNMIEDHTLVNVWRDGPPMEIVLPNPLLHDYNLEDNALTVEGQGCLVSERADFLLPRSIVRDGLMQAP